MCSVAVCFMAVLFGVANDLTSRMDACALAGMVTRLNSQISVLVSLRAPDFRRS